MKKLVSDCCEAEITSMENLLKPIWDGFLIIDYKIDDWCSKCHKPCKAKESKKPIKEKY